MVFFSLYFALFPSYNHFLSIKERANNPTIVNNIGPQTRFPVPEGILNYNGPNYLALTIWSMDSKPFQLADLQLQADAVIQSGYRKPDLVRGQHYTKRLDSY